MANTHLDSDYTISECPLILDCGLNVGDFTLLVKSMYPEAEVHGFEPFTALFMLAKENAKLNSLNNVNFVNAGVGECNKFTDMSTRRFSTEAASMSPEFFSAGLINFAFGPLVAFNFLAEGFIHRCIPKKHTEPSWIDKLGNALWLLVLLICYPALLALMVVQPKLEQNVRVISLGHYIRSHIPNRKIDLLKLDIEGYAYEALTGLDGPAWQLIQNISIEVEMSLKYDEIKDLLSSQGFQIKEFDWSGIPQIHAFRTADVKPASLRPAA